MKNYYSKQRRPMRAALFIMLLMTAGMTKSLAQTNVATLHHGDETSAFYGLSALSQAHEAAESGDLITLSSGVFDACEITKAITLRGAGWMEDTLTGVQPTKIMGDLYANVTDENNSLTIEGIWFHNKVNHGILNNPWFEKCYFEGNFGEIHDGMMQNATYVNCRFTDYFYNYNATNTFLVNSLLLSYLFDVDDTFTMTLNNSIMFGNNWNNLSTGLTAYNSIMIFGTYGYGCSFYNSVFISHWDIGDPFMVNCLNYGGNGSAVFVDYIDPNGNDWWRVQSFVLQPEFASSFLGTDGTEIGIYGGNAPFSRVPNYMRTRVTVASQSTEDGMLNVEVEFVNEDE
jgi:hypothetical protein